MKKSAPNSLAGKKLVIKYLLLSILSMEKKWFHCIKISVDGALASFLIVLHSDDLHGAQKVLSSMNAVTHGVEV